jgi:serine/threonine protein kinase
MGEVYRARDTRLGRDVAIKILPKEMSADATRKLRFEREPKAISGLNHPNICVPHDVGSQDGMDYLVMECLEGEALAKRLEKGALPLEQALKYGAQITDALNKVHRAGTRLDISTSCGYTPPRESRINVSGKSSVVFTASCVRRA